MLFVPPSMPYMVPEAEAETHTTPPVVTVPADISVSMSGESGSGALTNSTGTYQLVTFSVTASGGGGYNTDNINCRWHFPNQQASDYPAGYANTSWSGLPNISKYFTVGTYTVTCTAWNQLGLLQQSSFTITIIGDTTPPVVTVPADITVTTTDPGGEGVNYGASGFPAGVDCTNSQHICISDSVTASDDTAVTSGPFCDIPPTTHEFAVGTTTVTCTATDAAGNVGTASFTITVVFADTTLPVINFGGINQYEEITRTALNSTGYNFKWHVNVYDAGDTTVNAPTCYVNLVPVRSLACPAQLSHRQYPLDPSGTVTLNVTN